MDFGSQEEFDEWVVKQQAVDQEVLAALKPAAQVMAEDLDDSPEEVIVTKAVVVFQYMNGRGEQMWGYRKVECSWFDVGGAIKMLDAAHDFAWADANLSGEDLED